MWFIREVKISVSDPKNENHGGRLDYVVEGDERLGRHGEFFIELFQSLRVIYTYAMHCF